MNNVLQVPVRDTLLQRIAQVQASDSALWGRMTANEMLCHLADQFRVALRDIPVHDQSTRLTRSVVVTLVLLGVPAPKGKVKTFPEIDQATGHGTAPTDVPHDASILREFFEKFLATEPTFSFQAHSFFGPLTRQQWGRLIYIHSDYHLRQFGR
ncbi:MAG: DUF1569 domain-containing protein [bacterium]|nr:DUF1569 domain-containing protein [bacterium]